MCDRLFVEDLKALDSPHKVIPLLAAFGLAELPPAWEYYTPVRAMTGRFSLGTKRMLEDVSPFLEKAVDAVNFLRKVNAEILESKEGDCPFDRRQEVGYLYKKFAKSWSASHDFTEEDLQKFDVVKHKSIRPNRQDFDRPIKAHHQFFFYYSGDSRDLASSDYWKEHEAGHIGVSERTLGWKCYVRDSVFMRHFKLVQKAVGYGDPRRAFPAYYDFLCGKEVSTVRSVDFCFVAKCTDCSPEGLLRIARHYVENYLEFDQSHADVHADLDSIEISGIKLDKRELEGFHREVALKYGDFVRLNLYEGDFDRVFDSERGKEIAFVTFVRFTATFDVAVKLRAPTEHRTDLSEYRYGKDLSGGEYGYVSNLAEDDVSYFQRFRDAFEHPDELCVDGFWIVRKPTLDTLKECNLRRFFSENQARKNGVDRKWEIENVIEIFQRYGSAEERKALEFFENQDATLGMCAHDGVELDMVYGLGMSTFEARMSERVDMLEKYRTVIPKILELWDDLKSPTGRFRLFAPKVRMDPICYADSELKCVCDFARRLMV